MGKATGKVNKDRRESLKIGFWTMWRDVLIASMNKGQFPLAMIGLIFAIMLLRMGGDQVSELAFSALDKLERGWLLGYAWAIVSSLSWFFHVKLQRRTIHEEMKRLSDERTILQEKLNRGKLGSSQ